MKYLIITADNYEKGYLTGARIVDLPEGSDEQEHEERMEIYYQLGGQLSILEVSAGTEMLAIPLDTLNPRRFRIQRDLAGNRVVLPSKEGAIED